MVEGAIFSTLPFAALTWKKRSSALIIKPFVQNVATTSTPSFPEEESDESIRIPKEPDVGGLSDPVESMDGQAENSDI